MTITTKRKANGALTVKLNGKRESLDVAVRVALLNCRGNKITITNEHGVSYDYYGHCYNYSGMKTETERKLDRQKLEDAIRNFADYR